MSLTSYRHDGCLFDVDDSGGGGDGQNGGNVETVILLHGFPQSRTSWRELTPQLVDRGYRVIAPDQRGYSPGARPRRRRDYTLDKLAGDVIALADAADVERFHVLGHDWGGAVAWALGANHSDRVASVTSLSTPHPQAMISSLVSSDQLLRSWYMLFFQLPVIPELMVTNPILSGRFKSTLSSSGLPAAQVEENVEMLARGSASGGFNWYRALPLSWPQSVGSVKSPTLYIYGDADFALGPKAAELTRRYVDATYRFVSLLGAGHWLPETDADKVAPLLLEHLADHPI